MQYTLLRVADFTACTTPRFASPHRLFVDTGNITAEQGIIYSCRISTPADLNRQVVKSESATIRLPDMDFEIPPNTQRGLLNTVEGFLAKAKEDLEREQVFRMEQDWVVGEAVAGVIRKLGELIE